MAWYLLGAKPLSKPILAYCQSHPCDQTSVKFYSKFKHFHSKKCIWNCLQNRGHFCLEPQCVSWVMFIGDVLAEGWYEWKHLCYMLWSVCTKNHASVTISVNNSNCFLWTHMYLNTLRLRQNGCHFPDDIFKRIFLNENCFILMKISLKFVPQGPINNIPALVQIMAWRQPSDMPLSEPMIV